MSRGLGRVQRAIMDVFEHGVWDEYDPRQRRPAGSVSLQGLACEVFGFGSWRFPQPDGLDHCMLGTYEHDHWRLTDSQYRTVVRAVRTLKRRGLLATEVCSSWGSCASRFTQVSVPTVEGSEHL